MKTSAIAILVPVLVLGVSVQAKDKVEKDVTIQRKISDRTDDRSQPGATEKVAFLGVETMPVDLTVAAQLGLSREMGLVVRHVADNSPAASLLKEHDILVRLDDQILIDMHQLSVLVRSHKSGDEVSLRLLRGGKEMTVKATLAERELPKQDWDEMPRALGKADPGNTFFFHSGSQGFPGLAGPEASDMMRIIGRDRHHWFAKPRMHVMGRAGEKGSTILDMPSGNFVFSDDSGSVEVTSAEGKRDLVVKDKDGKVTFQGPLNGPDDEAKLPPEVGARLDAIRGVDLEEPEEPEVENRVLAPTTRTAFEDTGENAPEAGAPPF